MQGLPKLSKRSKLFILLAVIVLIGLISGSRFLNAYIQWLWFGEVGFRSVFTTVLVTRLLTFLALTLFVGGGLWLSMFIAYRTRPIFVPVASSDDPLSRYRSAITGRLKLIGFGIPILIGLIAAAAGQSDWQVVQLFLHGKPFGTSDPQFGIDYGFYAFTLPFLLWLKNWIFITIFLGFVGAAVTHYVYGSVRFVPGHGGQISTTARRQLAITIGVFVLLKAAAYWLDRYEVLYSDTNDKFTGATYTDLNALLPAKLILLCIAVFCAVAFFVGAFTRSLQLPAIATVLMLLSALILGAVWPALMEQFSVRANASQKQAVSIQRNIAATKMAYGITNDKITYQGYDPSTATATTADVLGSTGTINNVRLLDPNIISPTFNQFQQGRNFYGFPSQLNVDRYAVDGQMQDFVVAAREINSQGLSSSQNDWINRHLVYTHGNGFVYAPANKVGSLTGQANVSADAQGGYPLFQNSVVGSTGTGAFKVAQPRVYYGELATDYAVVGGSGSAREYDTDTSQYAYNGSGGVRIGNWVNRLAFSAYYKERNFLFNSTIDNDSRVIFNRDPRDRIKDVAPWLTVDNDAYPAVVDGKITWIVDAYTTLSNFPYSERTSLGATTTDSTTGALTADQNIGYIRNSVKATVDAYSGKVTLYGVDNTDPVLKAWESAFPGTVHPASDISASLQQHLRYPQDLFKIQRDLLTKYHVANAQEFYNAQGFWSVPADPTVKANSSTAVDTGSTLAQPPYYVVAQAPGQTQTTFQLTSALTALSRPNMASWMSVSSDPSTYGKFTILTLPTNTQTQGPGQVQSLFDTTNKVTQSRTLYSNSQVDVKFGNLLTLPVAGKLLNVEPMYIQQNNAQSALQLAKVLVEYDGRVGFESSFSAALQDALTGTDSGGTTTGGSTGGTSSSSSPSSTTPTTTTGGSALDQAVAAISQALANIKTAQASGDFAKLGQAYAALQTATQQYEAARGGSISSSSSTTSPPTSTR